MRRSVSRLTGVLVGVVVAALTGSAAVAPPVSAGPPVPAGPPSSGAHPAGSHGLSGAPAPVPAATRPVSEGVRLPAPRRVAELTGRRSANSTVFRLADGRTQAEVSTRPVHYRDVAGAWRDIDTAVRPAAGADRAAGLGFVNHTNQFTSGFGTSSDRLARFSLGGRSVTVGAAGASRAVSGRASGDTVTFGGVFGGADVSYQVTPEALKERIVLSGPPADSAFTFTVDMTGLTAKPRDDGSVAFFAAPGLRARPLFVMPAPFMTDSHVDRDSPYGVSWSPKVSQTVVPHGSGLTVTVRADPEWLADPKRDYPVVIDPTIRVEPTPTQSADTMILSDSPATNFDGSIRLSAGTTSTGAARTLVRFPLPDGLDPGTPVDSADLQMYYDQTFTSDAHEVPIEAHRATAAWDAGTATWNNANGNVGELGVNQVMVDDGDAGTSQTGSWPYSGNEILTALAVNGDYAFNNDAPTGDSYTWVPTLTEDGNYRVEAHYVTAGDRSTAAPYTVVGTGTSNETLDQTAGGTNVGVWGPLGTHGFVAGTTSRVTLHDVGSSATVLADAIRWTRDGIALKTVNQQSVWHTFPVRNIVQSWVDSPSTNHGFVLKTTNEASLDFGGPRYEASEFAYNGETANRPKLVLTWGRPSAQLDPVTVAHATGAELNWSAYPDPSSATADDIVEYQVHRSVFQTFTPTASTLIAPLDPAALSYTDTTATPTPADDPKPFGNAFYYMVAVRTRDGQLIPGPTQEVRLPKAGQVFLTLPASADTTLASGEPSIGHDVLDGQHQLGVGDTGGFADIRTLAKFPLSQIPAGATITSAQVRLWGFFMSGGGTATYNLHGLTRDFDEATATWNSAATGVPWTTPGGDVVGTASDSVTGITNDPAWRSWDITGLARSWNADPASNHGVLVKLANEITPAEQTLFLSSEGAEPQLRPNLEITYTEPIAEDTYYAPSTPDGMAPGDQRTVPVTLTNTTAQTWSAADRVLSYHWTLPDGTDVTDASNQLITTLPADVPPGGAVTLDANVKAPTPTEVGNKREQHLLTWDVKDTATGEFLSTSDSIPGLAQKVATQQPTSDQLGLEKFYQYAGAPTGAGGSVADNLFAGNLVWSYNAFSNPSRGVASFVRITYNSQDTSASSMGFGWSLSASSVMRLGSPLDFHPPGQSWPTTVTLTDGDGTSHLFTLNTHGSADEADWDYDHPAGVHLYLEKTGSTDTSRAWSMTAPDHTVFYFDSDGYQSAVADANGNTLLFTYESRKSNNKPIKFLKYLTDPSGRQTLTLDYYHKGDDYTFIDDTGTEVSDTNLTNPFIIDQVRSVTDISGRAVTFTYSDKGLMAKMVDGAGDPAAKTFRFVYDATQGNKNVKLVSVTDPRGHSAGLSYYSPPDDDPAFHWWAKTMTDRLGHTTSFTYADPDGTGGSQIQTLVTDAATHDTTYTMDGLGRPEQVVDAAGHVTGLHFDADHNVDRLTEDNGAVTTFTYDPLTGLPLTMTDAQANSDGTPATVYTYQSFDNGHTADLATKTSPEGRRWAFGYDTQHNLVTVTDPAGTATPTVPDDFTTRYTYDGFGQLLTATDANGNPTTYGSYDANGFPRTITDALTNSTSFVYDVRGQVTTVTDALGHDTTADYDVFGRPLASTVPKDTAGGVFITTPAPVYDANDNVTRSTAPNGAVATAVYDNDDRVVSTSAPKDTPTGPDRTATFGYDEVGNVLSQTEPDGSLTTADPDDFTTGYTYDPIYQLTAATDAAGDQITYDYDNVGNVTTVVDPRKNTTPDTTDFTTRTTYDLDHRAKTVTDAAGNVKSVGYDRDGNAVSSTDEDGNTTLVTPDARGKPSQVQVPFTDNAGTTVYNTTKYFYDQVGNQTKVETPRGVATAAAGDFVAETTYDPLNRVKDQLTPFDPADPRYNTADATTRTYDAVGRLTKVSAPPSAGQSVRNDTTFSYFDNGWTRSSVDPWDISTSYDYNLLGEQTSRTLTSAGGSSSRTMSWDFYPDGKLKSRTDEGVPVGAHVVLVDNSDVQNTSAVGTWPASDVAAGFEGFNYQTHDAGTGSNSFTWNLTVPQDGTYQVFVKYPPAAATNAPYTVSDSTGGTTTVPVNQTTGEGTWVSVGSFDFHVTDGFVTTEQKVTLTDDADGVVAADAVKLVRDNSADVDNENTAFTYGYDPNGNLVDIGDSSPGAAVDDYAVTYTGLDQVASVQEKLTGVVKHTTSYTYDENRAPLTRTHDTAVDTYAYGVRNLVASVTNAMSLSDPSPKVTTFVYTARGQVSAEVKGNANTVDYTYFLNKALRHQVEKKPDGTTVAEHTYDYDPNGNQTTDTSAVQNADNHAASITRTATSTYDPRDRLAAVTKTDAGSTVESESYVHGANNNVVSQTINGSTTDYTYDRNRLLQAVTGGVVSANNYDPFGRLDNITAGGQEIRHNFYDGFDRITKIQQTNGQTFYSYDPLDRTTSRSSDEGLGSFKETDFAYIGLTGQLADEITTGMDGTLTKAYQYSPAGQRLSQTVHNLDSTVEDGYYGYNAHSDVEDLTTDTGDTKTTYAYTAYGANDPTGFTGIDPPDLTNLFTTPYNAYRFNAKRFDHATGNYDMGFRDYNPGLNQFLTRDTYNGALADTGLTTDPYTGNRYAYGAGNPYTNIENDGHEPCPQGANCNYLYTGNPKYKNDGPSGPTCWPNCAGPAPQASGSGPAPGGSGGTPTQAPSGEAPAAPIVAGDGTTYYPVYGFGDPLKQDAKFLAGILGITDARDCGANADASACAWVAAGFIPAGKLLKIFREARLVRDGYIASKFAEVAHVLDRLPPYDGGKASGVLKIGDEEVPLQSGVEGPAASIPKGTAGFNRITKTHVEGHAAAILRQRGLKDATLYLNRFPCPDLTGCDTLLQRMLPRGSRLTVYVIPGGNVLPLSGPIGYKAVYHGLPE